MQATHLLYYNNSDYPKILRECNDAPSLLYAIGNVDFNHNFVLSIVGTRKPDDNAAIYIDKFVADLRQYRNDIVIVSGLALGVDTIAHKTAIKYGFKTVAVMGTGLDHIYPSENTDLANRIVSSGGAILTEYEYGHQISPDNFPQRNRIVAGLCDALLVVQSPVRGGSLITAKYANSYNRDVFAFPGRPDDELFLGCNYLIRNNMAALITSAEDIAWYLRWERKVL